MSTLVAVAYQYIRVIKRVITLFFILHDLSHYSATAFGALTAFLLIFLTPPACPRPNHRGGGGGGCLHDPRCHYILGQSHVSAPAGRRCNIRPLTVLAYSWWCYCVNNEATQQAGGGLSMTIKQISN